MPFFPTDIENKSILPLQINSVSANDHNSSSINEGYKHPLDLNRMLISNAPSTFFARIAGEEDDILIIDKSLAYEDGALVVVYEEGEFKLRRMYINEQNIIHLSAEDGFSNAMSSETVLWGRVTYYIKSML